MRVQLVIAACIVALAAGAARAQVLLDMPAPPVKTTGVSDEESIPSNNDAVGIVGYDTYEDEPLYASAGDVALFRYAGFRNFPRVTTVPSFGYGAYMNTFNGPWVYPPIWGWPVFFSGGFGFHHGHFRFNHCFPNFGGFHARFRFGGDHFRGHVRIGF
jgi:hypothetical protein